MRNFSIPHRITELQPCCLLPNDFLIFLLLTILNISSLLCIQYVHTCACVCILTHKREHMHTHASTCTTHMQVHAHECARMRSLVCAHAQVCLSNDRSLKYTCTIPQPPATSNLLILRPTTNFITIFFHLVALSCIICSVLSRFFSLSPWAPQKKQTAGPP